MAANALLTLLLFVIIVIHIISIMHIHYNYYSYYLLFSIINLSIIVFFVISGWCRPSAEERNADHSMCDSLSALGSNLEMSR